MSKSLTRAARLREIENILFRNPSGVKVTTLAAQCEVNRRTIYRDLELLDDAGVPIWQERGTYGIVRDQYLATVRLSFHEAIALYIAARLLSRHSDEKNPHFVSALTKLATALPDTLLDYINQTAASIHKRPVNESFVRVLKEISVAWAENRQVRIWYQSARTQTSKERIISPYTIEPSSAGGLYLIGHDSLSNEIRTFKFDRIEHTELMPETYEIPSAFNPENYLADAWGIMSGSGPTTTVRLLFQPSVSGYIKERIWHPSQIIHEHADSTIEYEVAIGDVREMTPWIRSWGAQVEVLEPETLRADIVAELHNLIQTYSTESR